jgi:translation initiation factor 1 (eIF-1/SUI1)
MRGKFACGASVTKGKDEIVIQGDVQDELYEIVITNFKVGTS